MGSQQPSLVTQDSTEPAALPSETFRSEQPKPVMRSVSSLRKWKQTMSQRERTSPPDAAGSTSSLLVQIPENEEVTKPLKSKVNKTRGKKTKKSSKGSKTKKTKG